jgi:hypothetical protein
VTVTNTVGQEFLLAVFRSMTCTGFDHLAASSHNNEQKFLPLSVDEFLRRFLLQGFLRIRNFGFLANRRRATRLPLCFHLLGARQDPPAQQDASSTNDSTDLWRCSKCDGPMKVIERLTAAEMRLCSPPLVIAAA